MPGQLTNAEKANRAQQIIACGKELEREFLGSFIGKTDSVLIETRQSDGMYCGYTDTYVKVCTDKGSPNEIIKVNIKSIKEDENGELSLL